MKQLTIGTQIIADERQNQIDKHGFTAEHHVRHPEWYDKEQLVYAAHALLSLEDRPVMYIKEPENWDREWFVKILRKAEKSKTYRYKVSAAFLAAEIDRITELYK